LSFVFFGGGFVLLVLVILEPTQGQPKMGNNPHYEPVN
jgi:hypothetical protein